MKVGVIGCGYVAQGHLAALRRVRGIELSLCDTDEKRAAETARSFGISRTYGDANDLLGGVMPDVVHILTPPQSHKRLAIEAMEAGCHVLVEKPMALDSGEADEMIETARRTGRSLCVCHNYLFEPPVLRARKLMQTGALGQVVGVEVFFKVYQQARYRTSDWMRTLHGGIHNESAPHLVALQREFLGNVRVVSAVAKPIEGLPQPSTELRALLEGESGLGSMCISFSSAPPQKHLTIYGTRATVDVDILNGVLLERQHAGSGQLRGRARVNAEYALRLLGQTVSGTLDGLGKPRWRSHANLVAAFYDSLRAGTPPPVSGQDGRAVVAVLDQLWAALKRRPAARPGEGAGG